MRRTLCIALLAAAAIAIPVANAETRTGQSILVDQQVFRASGTVQLLHARERTVVIDDREYSLPASSASSKVTIRGAKVDFSYREAKPLPVITEISIRR